MNPEQSRSKKSENDAPITQDEMKDAIWNSGYLLEQRVANKLHGNGYTVDANRGFIDPETQKCREYDVYAYKASELYGNNVSEIYPTLICSCKNNYLPVAFLAQEEGIFQPLVDEVRVSGLPSKIWQGEKYISIPEFVKVEEFHHYVKSAAPVATQCCTFERKKDKTFEANYDDKLFDTFKTIAKVLEQEIDDDYKEMNQHTISKNIKEEFVDLSFYYPVVIYQGDIFAVYGTNDLSNKESLRLVQCDHIQFNPEYYSSNHGSVISYHIDVITEKYLPTFLKIIDREVLAIRDVFQKQKQKVLLSKNKIIKECIKIENSKHLRNILEFRYID